MPQDRFFIDAPFSQHQTVALEDVEFHHLVNVMRIKEGETVELVNGEGQLASAAVLQIGKKNALLKIASLKNQPKEKLALVLAQALPKANRLDFILEKGTELGMTELWLFPGKLSEKKEINLARAKQVMIAAMKQSGRLFLPKLHFFPSLEKCPVKTLQPYFGDLSEEAPPLLSAYQKGRSSGIFIGPEKGFSKEEIEWLKKQGSQGVKLNGNILRTDTAAIAAVALITHFELEKSKRGSAPG